MESTPGRRGAKRKEETEKSVVSPTDHTETENAHSGCGWERVFELLSLGEKQVQCVPLGVVAKLSK